MASSTSISSIRVTKKKAPKPIRKHSGNALFRKKTSDIEIVIPSRDSADSPPQVGQETPHTDHITKNQTATGDEDFVIAVDLTLYANPLRCLRTPSPSPSEKRRVSNPKTDEKEKDLVAVDTVKYASPLEDLNLKNLTV